MSDMCRIAAFIGPQRALGSLLAGPPHSLVKQSYAAKELDTSVVSADGWGAAWYLADDSEPCVYRSTLPIWGDVNLRDLGRTVRSKCLLAAVRSATDPLSIAAHNTQPFKFERLSFMHNGYIENFRQTLRRRVASGFSDIVYDSVAGDTDSEHLFGLVSERWLGHAARPPKERLLKAVSEAVREARQFAKTQERKALLTLLVSDGNQLVAARSSENANSPSLYSKRTPEGVWFASEPLDHAEAQWNKVQEGSVVIAGESGNLESLAL